MKRKNYRKMLQDIDNLVNNDWAFELDCKQLPHSKPYTQKEAKEMINVIGKVYLISHGITCSCGDKYRI